MARKLLRFHDLLGTYWRYGAPRRLRLAALLLLPLLAACATRGTVAQTHNVASDGSSSVGVRSASDAAPGVLGAQELFGAQIPFGPFTAKAALIWDGQPWFYTPAPAAPAAAPLASPCAAPQVVEEEYVEMEKRTIEVPVTKTRKRVVIPVPQAAPPCNPAPRSCSCGPNGCGVPETSSTFEAACAQGK